MPTLPDTTDNNKKAVLAALTDSRGIVSTACENANVGRSTFYEWMNDDPEFKAAVEAVNESAIDFVESKLFERINGVCLADKDGNIYSTPPSDTAIIFYLKTKAKKRGYIERTELTGADGNPLAVVWNEQRTYETKDAPPIEDAKKFLDGTNNLETK